MQPNDQQPVLHTRDQRYAAQAYLDATGRGEAHGAGSIWTKEYGGMAHKLPVLIRTAGLAQAIAFVERGKEPHQALLADVAAATGHPDLAKDSRDFALGDYMNLTHEVLAALLWYKRYAESVMGVKDAGAVGGPGT